MDKDFIELFKVSDCDLINYAISIENDDVSKGINQFYSFCPADLKEIFMDIKNKEDNFFLPEVINVIPKKLPAKFSLSEISLFLNSSLFRVLKESTLKSWISSSYKEFIGKPKLGKKYSLSQLQKTMLLHDLSQVIPFDQMHPYLEQIKQTEHEMNEWLPLYLRNVEINYYVSLLLKTKTHNSCIKQTNSYKEINKERKQDLFKIRNIIQRHNCKDLFDMYKELENKIELHRKISRLYKLLVENNNKILESNKVIYDVEIKKTLCWFQESDTTFNLENLSMEKYDEYKSKKYEILANSSYSYILKELLPVLETGYYINILKSEYHQDNLRKSFKTFTK
ncbi:hypothetical protein [Priestia aryabhattai]